MYRRDPDSGALVLDMTDQSPPLQGAVIEILTAIQRDLAEIRLELDALKARMPDGENP
jgi:hypothetical protein